MHEILLDNPTHQKWSYNFSMLSNIPHDYSTSHIPNPDLSPQFSLLYPILPPFLCFGGFRKIGVPQ